MRSIAVFVLAVAIAGAGLLSTRPEQREPVTSVLFILVDTLRADHLSCYGYERETSPHIDRLARGGVRFEHAIVQRPQTSPSVASFITGLYPFRHGLDNCRQWLPDVHLTLAEVLRDSGYRTASFYANHNVGSEFNFHQGFEHTEYDYQAGDLTDLATSWLDRLEDDERYFLYVHYVEPHDPYEPPSWARSLFGGDNDAITRYDQEIATVDRSIGRLLESVDPGNTLIVFTSDHGEAFGEHDGYYGHGKQCYEHQIRIPLIINHPSLKSQVRTDVVESVDVMPTVLSLLGLRSPAACDGIDLLAGCEKSWACSESDYGVTTVSLRTRTEKWIQWESGIVRRFDLIADPSERSPRISLDGPDRLIWWSKRARSSRKSRVVDVQFAHPEVHLGLMELGYIQ